LGKPPEQQLPIKLSPSQLTIVREILCAHVPQHEVWAFGSRVAGTAKPYSDLDLAIISDEPLSIAVTANLAEAFSESDLPWKVDVVEWARTEESFRRIIKRNYVVVQAPLSKGDSTRPL
jgi:predicted nucleotidyltransferase